jgi:hypothetical protein
MKYTRKGGDWVDIDGAHELTMREYNSVWIGDQATAREIVASIVTDCHFLNRKGIVEGKPTGDNLFDLTIKQWDWLREKVGEATRDNDIDPE